MLEVLVQSIDLYTHSGDDSREYGKFPGWWRCKFEDGEVMDVKMFGPQPELFAY